MCLYDSKRFRFTLKPIKVYKIVVAANTTKFFSPYYSTKINKYMFGYFGHPIKLESEDLYEFGKGFIHAYISLESASEMIKQINKSFPRTTFKIITGYIPRFTRYAKEKFILDPTKKPYIEIKEVCARIMVFPNLNKKE